MKIERSDGCTTYTIHQSDLNTYLTCPERFRKLLMGEVQDFGSEAAAKGTAVHAGIEELLRGGSHDDGLLMAHMAWTREAARPGFRYVKTKSEETCFKHIRTALDAWHTKVYPTLGSTLLLETPFDLPLFSHGPISVRVAGRIDHGDEPGLTDWKVTTHTDTYTAGYGGEGWKLQRFGPQPTVYTYAGWQLGFYEPPVSFTFVAVHPTTGQVTYLPCSRSEADWEWLKRLCWNLVTQLTSNLAEWPLNDQHALCSSDWCPAYAQCKGALRNAATAQEAA